MSVGIRHDDLRRRNRAMVIAAVRRAGRPSRTEIAATTGLSHSTISAISSDLIGEGILAESKPSEAGALKRGRPQVGLGLNPEAAAVMTVVLSLNFLSVAVIDYAGQVVSEEQRRLDTLTMSREALIGECVAIVRRRLEDPDIDVRSVARIALAIQGITDTEARSMLWSPITPQTDIAFADILEAEFGIPATMENDCNMMAVALRWRDPERYRDDFIAILLSHGIGMGLVLKGELFTGTHSSGGEFGHMIHRPGGALCRCGRRGCVEAYAGNYAIWRNARQLSEDTEPVADVSDDADAGTRRHRAGKRRARARGLPQGRRGIGLRPRQPVRADRSRARRHGRRQRRRLRPDRAGTARGHRPDRRRPALEIDFLRHRAERTAPDPRRLRHARADLRRPGDFRAGRAGESGTGKNVA